MKKRYLVFLLLLNICILSGCCTSHNWKDATCTAPETCEKCGKTKGEALGHIWKEATCTEAKTCERCGEAEGTAQGHKWLEATCTEPKTCENCKATEGEALGHDFAPANLVYPETCNVCGATQGSPISFKTRNLDFVTDYDKVYLYKDNALAVTKTKKNLVLAFFSKAGELLNSVDVNSGKHNWSYSVFQNESYSVCAAIGTSDNSSVLTLYDWEGNAAASFDVTYDAEVPSYADCKIVSGDDKEILLICDPDNGSVCKAYELPSLNEVAATNYLAEKENPEFLSKYKYYEYCEAIQGYVVYDSENDNWDYLDLQGQQISLIGPFFDATSFTENGYCFVSNEEGWYALLNSELKYAGEKCFEADSISVVPGTNTFVVVKGDTVEYYFVSTD